MEKKVVAFWVPVYLFSLFIVWHIYYWYLKKPWGQWETLFDYSNSKFPFFLYSHWIGGSVLLLFFPAVHFSAKAFPKIHQKVLGYGYLLFGTLPAATGGLGHLIFNDTSPFKISFIFYGVLLLIFSWKVFAAAQKRNVEEHRIWGKRTLILSLASLTYRICLAPLLIGGSLELFNVQLWEYTPFTLSLSSLLMWAPSIFFETKLYFKKISTKKN